MSVQFGSRTVPGDAAVKEAAGLPLGIVVTPFEEIVFTGPPLADAPLARDLGRCGFCGAYVNPYVKFTCDRSRVPRSWHCFLCGEENAKVPPRYAEVAQGTGGLAELKAPALDFPLGDEEEGELVFLFVVDVAGAGDEFVDLAKNCLMAALESIPRGSLVGLATVAETVSVYDLGSKRPHVKQVVVPESCPVRTEGLGMEELLPLSRVLVPIDDEHEDVLLQAVESLHRFVTAQGGSAQAKRGVGTAVRMVVDYFAAYRDLKGARVGLFLGGRPSWGEGALASHRLMDIEPETSFYADEAALATSVTIDLFCAGTEGETLGLASLKYLPLRTGGVLVTNVQPQDLYRLYKSLSAVNCEIAIRTSPDVSVATDYQTPLSLSTCSVRDSFSYDLEFTSSGGTFAEYIVVQVAFVYSVAVPALGNKLRRFLRVITARGKTSLSWRMVYPSVVPEVLMTLLAHKVMRACFDESVEQARTMLKRWLFKLNKQCEENQVSLGVFANMKDLPRFVFGLLSSPILRCNSAGSVVSADEWTNTQVRFFCFCLLFCSA